MKSAENDFVWKTFVRQFVVFLLNVIFKVPKGHRRFMLMSFPVRYDVIEDFPKNLCLREDYYKKLMNLTIEDLNFPPPEALIACIDAMLASPTARDFETWLDQNYDDFYTPRPISELLRLK